MDKKTLENLADFICGDDKTYYPQYRKGYELTQFFNNCGLSYVHDGNTRKWWVLDKLIECNNSQITDIIKRLASPREYNGNKEKIKQAISVLNEILYIEGLKVKIQGIDPIIERVTIDYSSLDEDSQELKPLPPPNFTALQLGIEIESLLEKRWNEADICFKNGAYTASIIIMGSLLEGMLLGTLKNNLKEANQANAAPKDKEGKVKKIHEWTLSEMINVAHTIGWLDLDIKKFSHSLREFRNLIHPYQQIIEKNFPDKDTCEISWLVVQAATNDLAKVLIKQKK